MTGICSQTIFHQGTLKIWRNCRKFGGILAEPSEIGETVESVDGTGGVAGLATY